MASDERSIFYVNNGAAEWKLYLSELLVRPQIAVRVLPAPEPSLPDAGRNHQSLLERSHLQRERNGGYEMRPCAICGNPLPVGSTASRKYCPDCSEKHSIELAKIRSEKNNQKRAEMRAAAPPFEKPRRTLREEDMAYCRKCKYAGRFTEEYLCNFYLMEGKRRGCKAGKGCKKRIVITGANMQRICERCGVAYTGGPKTRYCPDCRREVLRQNAIRANEARRKKHGGCEKRNVPETSAAPSGTARRE